MIILLIILILIVLIIWYYYISFIKSLFFTKVPYVWTFNRQLKILKKLDLKKGSKILDLWCWDWKALRFFEKEFWLKWVWYDINTFAILYGKLLNKLFKSNIKIFRWNFLKQDISKYDYIYLYLFPDFLAKIEDWIFENKKKDAVIISTAFTFKKHKPFKIIAWKIYLYI